MGKCGSPRNITCHTFNFTAMKLNLMVSASSDVRKMSGCSKTNETYCGIQYRQG